MLKYTKSAVSDTLDFIKRLIYVFQIVIQLVYIGYFVYRLVDNLGNKIGNIILLLISAGCLLFQIVTTKEFYTKKQILQKKTVKQTFKVTKYLVNIGIIALAVISLVNGNADNENAAMLITFLMMLGVLFSILFDVILVLIDKQMALIHSALLYDIEIFKEDREIPTALIKIIGLDLKKLFPKFDDKKAIEKVIKVNYKQEQKKVRKGDFHKKTKKR